MSVYISVELQRRVRERFGDCCAYCRTAENLTVVTFEFEHIVPRSAGGLTEFDNLCISVPPATGTNRIFPRRPTRSRRKQLRCFIPTNSDGPSTSPGMKTARRSLA